MVDRPSAEIERRASAGAGQFPASLVARTGVLLGVAAAYAGLAVLGFFGNTTHPLVSSIWPAAGLALVAFWQWGRWCWPAVAVASCAVNLWHGAPLLAAVVIGIGNATGPMVAARVLRRTRFSAQLERMRDGLYLLACGALLGPAISAMVGATALYLAQSSSLREVLGIGLTWWSGDAFGVGLAAPLAFAWMAPRDASLPGGRLEAYLLAGVALGLTAAVFLSTGRNLAWTAFPIVAWSALRFGVRGSSSVVALVAVIATAGAASGHGPFASDVRSADLRVSQLFLSALTMSGFLLATFWREHRVLLVRLLEIEQQRAVAEELTGSGSWAWDPQADRVTWSDGLHRLFGTSRSANDTTMQTYLERVHPAERQRVHTTIQDALGDPQGFHGEEQVIRADNASTRIVESFGRVLRDTGGKPVLVGACVDITERKHAEMARERLESAVRQSEAELLDLIRAAPVGIFRKSTEGELLMANRALVSLLGYTSAGELLAPGRRYHLYHDAYERERILAAFRAGAESLAAVVSLRRADGTAIRVQWDARAVRDAAGGVRFLECFVRDLTERLGMEQALRESRDRLAVLSRQLIGAQEAERRALARGLHDEIGQTLTAVRLGLVALRGRWPGSQPPAELTDSIVAVDAARDAVLDMSLDLRPSILDDLGLEAALRWYVARLGQRAGVRVHVTSDLEEHRLDPHVETACYRIAQEALTNVMRHARASAVDVSLSISGAQLELVIFDDGGGFDVEASAREPLDGRLGLVGMAERASLTGGQLHVHSAPGRGTRITAQFPLTAVPTDQGRTEAG